MARARPTPPWRPPPPADGRVALGHTVAESLKGGEVNSEDDAADGTTDEPSEDGEGDVIACQPLADADVALTDGVRLLVEEHGRDEARADDEASEHEEEGVEDPFEDVPRVLHRLL